MKRKLRQTFLSDLEEYEHEKAALIEITQDSATEWCVYLSFLYHDLLEAMVVSDATDTFTIEVTVDPILQTPLSEVVWQASGCLLKITRAELERWLLFFLSFLRDGIAVVGHLDVESRSRDPKQPKGLDLVLMVDNALPPRPSKELRKKLKRQ